jgi:GAF domain-containing protein
MTCPGSKGRAMKRRSKAGGEQLKGRRRKAPRPKRSNATKAVPRSNSSATTAKKTEVARLTGENNGLLSELRECLQQGTATAEVLSIISRSTFDLSKVLNTVLELGARLSNADKGVILRAAGNASYYAAATYRHTPEFIESQKGILFEPGRSGVVGRVLLEGKSVQVADVFDDPEYAYREFARHGGFRTILGVPLVREGSPIGLFVLHRAVVRPFTDKQIKLVETFADQAVIAIENARLLNELRQRTTELSEALEQQTATADVLKVISRSQFDLQLVLDNLIQTATSLCGAKRGVIFRRDGDLYRAVAFYNATPELIEFVRSHPIVPGRHTITARVALERRVIHVADLQEDAEYAYALRDTEHIRTELGVPMFRGDDLVGVFILYKLKVEPFSEKQIELVTTFADQAVIAIENVRLLNELRERTEEVEKLNQHLEHRVADQVGEIERMGRLRRFLPPQVADLIVASGSEKQLESHRREITALFCDLRGFTGFTESADAEDVMALLRDYHAAIGEIIIKYNGTLERYAGDGVMVVFNDPVPVENPALQAVLMALELRNALGALTDTWSRLGHEIGFGIGIAHGFATLGTIGFEGRFDYAAIGTVSNVASRLCDEAKPGQILISPRVLMKVEHAVKVEPVGEFELKGIRRPLSAYNVVAAQMKS